jgi:hypothetical protein
MKIRSKFRNIFECSLLGYRKEIALLCVSVTKSGLCVLCQCVPKMSSVANLKKKGLSYPRTSKTSTLKAERSGSRAYNLKPKKIPNSWANHNFNDSFGHRIFGHYSTGASWEAEVTANSVAQLRRRSVSRNDKVLHVPELCKVTSHYQAGIHPRICWNSFAGPLGWSDHLGTAGISYIRNDVQYI